MSMCTMEQAGALAFSGGSMGGEGLRMLGLAARPHGSLDDHHGYAFLGLVALEDPIRDGVTEGRARRQGGYLRQDDHGGLSQDGPRASRSGLASCSRVSERWRLRNWMP